ncbi:prolyl oligopeptidase family serine peptidase [Arenimonas sp.]|nr:prolyl oligopeptidase family serine peptidase [Candidatus Parcubacteria bacterium]
MDTNYNLIQHFTETDSSKVESLIFKKEEQNISHLVFFIHGFNVFGAWDSMFPGTQIIENTWTPVYISQPGFGYSEGERDYCGPNTYTNIAKAIEDISEKYNIPVENRVIWGVSRGAIVTSLLSAKYPDSAAAFICQSGAYDFKMYFQDLNKDLDINENITSETKGASDQSLQERSVINFIKDIQKPILILHGDKDKTINASQAKTFSELLEKEAKKYELQIVDGPHWIGPLVRKQFVYPFIKKIFE